MTLLMPLIIGVVLGGIVALVVSALRASATAGTPAAIRSSRARSLGVREITSGGRVQYWAGFRFADGHEREFLTTASQAAVIVRGQSGTVHYAGDRLTGWVPELDSGPTDIYRSY